MASKVARFILEGRRGQLSPTATFILQGRAGMKNTRAAKHGDCDHKHGYCNWEG